MKKSFFALFAAVLLLGVVLFMNKKTESAQGQASFAFDTTQVSQVGEIRVFKNPDTALLVNKSDLWVTGPADYPVDTAKFNKVVNILYRLQSGEVVSRNPDRASEYGLDSVNAKHVNWKDKSGKTVGQVIIGKGSGIDFNSTYWKFADKPEVYRTPGNFSYDIMSRTEDWKDRKPFVVAVKDLQFMDVTWKDSTGMSYQYKLEAVNDSTWRMLSPQPNDVKRAMAQGMAGQLVDMYIDEFVAATDTNKSKIQLDSPAVVVKLDLKGGKSYTLKTSKILDNYAYALHPTRSDTIKVAEWRLAPFKKKPFELIEPPKDTVKADSAKPAASAVPMASPALAAPKKPSVKAGP